MKRFVVIAAIFVSWSNTAELSGVAEKGNSVQYRSEDTEGNYGFGYAEEHSSGGTFRREMGDSFGNKYGSYGLRNIDGRLRIVRYVADADGFRADIQSNEPTFEVKNPADVAVNTNPKDPVMSYKANIEEVTKSADGIRFRPQHLISFGASYNEMLDV